MSGSGNITPSRSHIHLFHSLEKMFNFIFFIQTSRCLKSENMKSLFGSRRSLHIASSSRRSNASLSILAHAVFLFSVFSYCLLYKVLLLHFGLIFSMTLFKTWNKTQTDNRLYICRLEPLSRKSSGFFHHINSACIRLVGPLSLLVSSNVIFANLPGHFHLKVKKKKNRQVFIVI